jgi:predicted nucleic acid-binding protein
VKSAYLDASCIIYLIEGEAQLRAAVSQRLEAVSAEPDGRLVTSRLSLLECRAKPLREGDAGTLAAYDSFFSAARLFIVDLGPAVVDRATELRARYGLKTPDALHVAAALEAGVDFFVTGDETIKRCSEIVVELVSPSRL